MRNLTIRRTKSFVGCLAGMKVYIEDPAYNEITINNVPCRKIGDLKNGEEKTFVIGDNEARVFVIADKLSKNYCNEFYNIPAGTEPVFLSGQNRYNPASGNAFRFDGITDEAVLKNRKKGTKKGLVVLVAAVVIGGVIGALVGSGMLFDTEVEPKEFSYSGMNITLTNEFTEISADGYTVCYDSENVAVLTLEEKFDSVEGFEEYTLEQYGELVLEANGLEDTVELQNRDGLTCFEYQYNNPDTNVTYSYFTVLYKEYDAFWMIQFATPEENMESYHQTFADWAKTVEFSE